MKKLAIRLASALALLAFASPALACGDKATTASTEKSDKATKKEVAKAEKSATKTTVKTATASN
jgi:Cu/Ag efflux protein CusF